MHRLASQRDLEVRPAKSRRISSVSELPAALDGVWSPDSWRVKPIKQQPYYENKDKLISVFEKLSDLPPLVQPSEVDLLKKHLAEAGDGKRFVLQGGDCAERFQDCSGKRLDNKMRILLQMGMITGWGSKVPVTHIGRIAGQYMKPRSKPTEMVEGREVMAYKGDAINGFDLDSREHDPQRLVDGYFHSAATLNYVRAILSRLAEQLRKPESWDSEFIKTLENLDEFHSLSKDIADALTFIESYTDVEKSQRRRVDGQKAARCTPELFTSHEGLVLEFEQAMTRRVDGEHYNLGAHFVWIGDRTRQLDGAHVEYFRGIANPIGCKCGPTTVPSELCDLIRTINPSNAKGKIMLISRFGAGLVKQKLPEIIKAVQEAGLNVVWQCDPMHGNTYSSPDGIKTRKFENILSEVRDTFQCHAECGSTLAGVHFEMCGEAVTECVGGSCGVQEGDLSTNYESFCDPRLNWQQSIEMAFKIVNLLKASRM